MRKLFVVVLLVVFTSSSVYAYDPWKTNKFPYLKVGGGYGQTGTDLNANGNIQTDGDVTIDGALAVTGGVTYEGAIIIDVNDVEALLIRENGDGGDVFDVDTTTSTVTITSATNAGGELSILKLFYDSQANPAFDGTLTIDIGSVGVARVTSTGALDLNSGAGEVTFLNSSIGISASELYPAANASGIGLDIPVSGVDAGAHEVHLQIDNTTFFKGVATGNGAGGIGGFKLTAVGELAHTGGTSYAWTQSAADAAAAVTARALDITGGAHTSITDSTEATGIEFDLSANKTWAAGIGPLAVQREIYIKAPTYIGDAGGALVMTEAATVDIDAAPTAGANMTISTSLALRLGGNTKLLDDLQLIFGTDNDWRIEYDEATSNSLVFSEGTAEALALAGSNTSATFVAANDIDGNDVYLITQEGGVAATDAGSDGGDLLLVAGAGSNASGGDTAGGVGGGYTITSGIGGNGIGGGDGGNGGAFTLTTGTGGTGGATAFMAASGGDIGITTGTGGTMTADFSNAGTGGGYTVTIGDGGDGSGANAVTGGLGGAYYVTAGSGGDGINGGSGGFGGSCSLYAGSGGSGGATGAASGGGSLSLSSGSAGSAGNAAANGGGIYISTGTSFSVNSLVGVSGDIAINSGSGVNTFAGNDPGGASGAVSLYTASGGSGSGSGVGGNSGALDLYAGAAGGTATGTAGSGGAVALYGGDGGDTTGVAGNGGDGSTITITAGNGGSDTETSAGTGGDGGDIILILGSKGTGNTDGVDGELIISPGTKCDGYAVRSPAEVQTTDANQTTIDFITLLDENTYHVDAWVVGVKSDGTDRASYHISGTVYRTGAGVATIQGAVTSQHTVESNAAWDATFTVNGSDLRVSVTGVGANTIEWVTTLRYMNMSN
jgi:hypothetical protein